MITLKLLLFNSLYIPGIWIITRYGFRELGGNKRKNIPGRIIFDRKSSMVFGWFGFMFEKYLPRFIHKPLISCVTCMASIHGTYFYFIFHHLNGTIDDRTLIIYPVYLLCLAALNTLFWLYYENRA